jgi:hypothetical protein
VSALAAPVRPEADAGPPLPWRRMAWVIWRQHRLALAGVAALLGALAVCLLLTGLQLHHAYATATACRQADSAACQDLFATFNGMDGLLANGVILQVMPGLIGAFVGAPLLARELENGTFRYAWTLAFGRTRWALAELVPLAVTVMAAAELFSLVLSWYYQPYFAASNPAAQTPFFPGLFGLRGVAFAAWTLAAFSVGALAGMLTRRVVPAIVATLAIHAGLTFAAGGFLRQHYLAPLLTSSPSVPGNAWIISQWWTRGGNFAFAGRPSMALLSQFCSAPPAGPGGPKPSLETFAQCLARHGYTEWTSYQPAGRFWVFQWIEGGWLLALSLLLISVTVWLVRHRAA